jgi:arylsulfatase A-like enzyme
MMQIPFIFRQPGRIAAGATSDLLVSNYDFLPSLLGYLELGDQLPQSPRRPGRDFSRVLLGHSVSWDNMVFYEMETCRAVRSDRWKLVQRYPDGPHELYDMQADPQERFNLYGQPGLEVTRETLAKQLEAFFAEYAEPKYDVWRGGGSKARRLTQH